SWTSAAGADSPRSPRRPNRSWSRPRWRRMSRARSEALGMPYRMGRCAVVDPPSRRPNRGFFFGPRITKSDGEDPTTGDNPVDSVDNAVTVRPIGGVKPAKSGDLKPQPSVDQTETGGNATEGNRPQRGSDLARAALEAARATAKKSGKPAATPK